MISTTNRIASDNNISVWVVPEVSPGVLVPPDPDHKVAAFEISYPDQQPEYTNSKEKNGSRDVLDRCQGSWPAGSFGFKTNVRPDGLGVIPAEDQLIFGATCKRTINAGVSVEYDPDLIKPSFSVWMLVDHTMIGMSGATIGKAELSIAECALEWTFEGKFMRMFIAGTDEITQDVASGQNIVFATDVDKYTSGSYIVLADSSGSVVDDNGGAGYEVDVVDPATESFNVFPDFTIGTAAGGFVAPLDVGGTIKGNRLESRTAVMSFDGEDTPVIDFTWTLTDEADYLEKEKTPTGFPISYSEAQRLVEVAFTLAFRRDDASMFVAAVTSGDVPVLLSVGDTDGYKFELSMPRCMVDVPKPEEDAPRVNLTGKITALATNGEDSFKVTYK